MSDEFRAGYAYLLPEPRPEIARTVCLGDDIMVDLAADGRIVGIEWLGGGDWTTALVHAALAGRLRVA